MNRRHFFASLAIFLTVVLVAPSAFFFAPQRAHALFGIGDIVFDPTNVVQTTISAVENTITAIATPISAAAAIAQQVNTYVLQPLAFVLSGNLMKMLTSSVIGFVIGKANGTGIPQFVVDVRKSMQTVSDGQALAYLRQVGQTNSPFAGSISSALNTDYLTKSSLAGFWAANMCTLSRSSPNVSAYLAGNYSQGGVSAWFALTTQAHNNPYPLYYGTQAQLGNVIGSGVGGATGARQQELSWGQGFMSWCGESDTATQTQAAASAAMDACIKNGGTTSYCDKIYSNAGGAVGGINPGDACAKSDGTGGTIKTPGSVIKSTLDKVLGGQQDSILRMGNVGPQINSILKDVGSIVSTVNFASSLLGGSSGGLFGSSQTSSANPTSRLAGFTPTQDTAGNFTSAYGGVSQGGIYQDASTLPSSGGSKLDLVTKYEKAWGSIDSAVNAASTTVSSLVSYCSTVANNEALALWNASKSDSWIPTPTTTDLNSMHSVFIDGARAQAISAQEVLTVVMPPIVAKVTDAYSIATAARAMVQKVQAELAAATGSTYVENMKTLETMPPTLSDVSYALQKAAVTGSASAAPTGSLNVSANSFVDQMNLIRTNAEALKISACTASPDIMGGWNGM